ncbi:nuclease A inhibitor family protein [Mucilaginibacter galii]|uniref:Sugar-non-specific nuclease inhibitor NuiA-like protein n=1 Tax=Mucilaginibacter galii TaxID=2005073 RepID=A0A917MZL4_9SPHI|nr:nuclease A inhibitor family protein [Mucilaginibacter galii]GGI49116.1 sugar-non-specific nuclease inhibitor NuiA-like protein [Mucilaginibacter galii]
MTIQNKLESAASGLMMMSESDYPFEYVNTNERQLTTALALKLAQKPEGTTVEQTTIEHLLRNLIDPTSGSVNIATAQRFQQLMAALKQELTNLTVYRVGDVQVQVFILGLTADGTVGGMRTMLIET